MRLTRLTIQPRHYAAILVLLCYVAIFFHPLAHIHDSHFERYTQGKAIALTTADNSEAEQDCTICRQTHDFSHLQPVVLALVLPALLQFLVSRQRLQTPVAVRVWDISTRGPPAP